ncbi:MAG: hypothetical protein LBV11_14690 [Bacillus cereus]|jgi:hypothetical protein|nr:hypothetical protein [Bacillus cereus]
MKIAKFILLALLGLVGIFLIVSVFMPHHQVLVEVSRETTASKEKIWKQFSDVPNRKNWDKSIEYAKINGPFQMGATGEIKLHGQSPSQYEIIVYKNLEAYTDRFFLPMFANMDFVHTIQPTEKGNKITFRVELSGPFIFVYASMIKETLEQELPGAVDNLVSLAEKDTH